MHTYSITTATATIAKKSGRLRCRVCDKWMNGLFAAQIIRKLYTNITKVKFIHRKFIAPKIIIKIDKNNNNKYVSIQNSFAEKQKYWKKKTAGNANECTR